MLALSSLSKSSRYVGILYAGIIFFTAAIYGAMLAITGQHAAVVAVARREPGAGRRRHLPAEAALRDAVAGLAHRHPRPHRAVDLGARAARPRRGGGHVSAPIVTAEHVSKWYGQVIGLNDVTVERAARHHRAARPERRRQVDVHEADHRPAQAEQGIGQGARRADLAQPAPVFPDRVLPGAGRVLRADDRPRVGHGARAPERPRREGGRRRRAARADRGRSDGRGRQEDRRLQQGHAAAREARAGDRPRSGAADPRRAAVGHGSARAPQDDPADPRVGARRQEHHRLEPHPARDRVDDRRTSC